MNGIEYLADTNCFIYLLDQHPLIEQFTDNRWSFSYITEMELLSKKGITKEQDAVIRAMLAVCVRVPHSQEITEATIRLRKKYSLKLPDAIIAATALSSNLPPSYSRQRVHCNNRNRHSFTGIVTVDRNCHGV
ncbi:MAG: type II toxin-antitoxin system VapC family toxin [Taibaiella sp.]|nr:type II toxin-antitoxin system VapC family toxin [Taibaiella sp.]